jgi:3-phosphoshikimate 1-carboxyvinyltransferase
MTHVTLTPPTSPIKTKVSVPGSKSYTNRGLLMAALATGVTRLSKVSPSSDSEALVAALRTLGIGIHAPDDTTLVVEGCGGRLNPYIGTIDVGPAGTTMRFLTALCAGIPGADITLRGTERMHARPIRDLVETLRQAGARIDYLGTDGCPPLRIHSTKSLIGGRITLNGSTSSQYITALLLTAPLFQAGLEVTIEGVQTSTPYIDMTLQSLRDFGLTASHTGYQHFTVKPGQCYRAGEYQVEGDASGASYLWAIAAIGRGTVTVENINPLSAQGDIKFPELLRQMGCEVHYGEHSVTVSGPAELHAIEADMTLMPDPAQTLAVVAACAHGTTVLRGLHTLPVKETDRIAALHQELLKMGIQSETGSDYLIIHGGEPHGARIATYEDHRMAMSFATLAAKIPAIEIEEPRVVDKSFPSFWETLAAMGISGEFHP